MMSCSSNMRRFLWVCLLLGLGGGCGPMVVLDAPEHFPEKWLGRKLYHTPNAYIYASNPLAAGEADREVARVGKFLREKAGGTPGKGLVIVTDCWDEVIDSDLAFLSDHASRRQDRIEDKVEFSPTDLRALMQRKQRELAKEGVDFLKSFKQYPLRLDTETLASRFGFAPEALEEVDWAAAISTGAAIRQGYSERVWEWGDHPGPIHRLLHLIWEIENDIWARKALPAERAGLLFEQLVMSQPQWTMEEKRELMDAHGMTLRPCGFVSWEPSDKWCRGVEKPASLSDDGDCADCPPD